MYRCQIFCQTKRLLPILLEKDKLEKVNAIKPGSRNSFVGIFLDLGRWLGVLDDNRSVFATRSGQVKWSRDVILAYAAAWDDACSFYWPNRRPWPTSNIKITVSMIAKNGTEDSSLMKTGIRGNILTVIQDMYSKAKSCLKASFNDSKPNCPFFSK